MHSPLAAWPEPLPADTVDLLTRFHGDHSPTAALRERLRAHADDPAALHRIVEPIAPPPEDCAAELPPEGTEAWAALDAEGTRAIAAGEVAVVVLAGGMATRFGSVIKALAEVFEGVRFLDAKAADLTRWRGAVPAALMTSFATDEAIAAALEADGHSATWARAPQFVSLRLRPDGALFRDGTGRPSPYATGHGDLPEALRDAGLLDAWRARGVRTVLVSNVDNLGATVDPALYAHHRRAGGRITVELVSKWPGDRGGLPVSLGGHLVLAEAFRLPAGFPDDDFPLFNTNTLWIDLDVLDATARPETPWTWCVAQKKVDGRPAIQFERLVGELTWWHPTRYVRVAREGHAARFVPVKEVEDLDRYAEALRAVWARITATTG